VPTTTWHGGYENAMFRLTNPRKKRATLTHIPNAFMSAAIACRVKAGGFLGFLAASIGQFLLS
jgi:hypothetical protein